MSERRVRSTLPDNPLIDLIRHIRIIDLTGFKGQMPDNFDSWDNFYQKSDIIQGFKLDGANNTRIAGKDIRETPVLQELPYHIGIAPIVWYIGAHLWMPGQKSVRDAVKNGIERMTPFRSDYRHENK